MRSLAEMAGCFGQVRENSRLTNGGRQTRDSVEPASSDRWRILAVNIVPHRLEQVGIGMKCRIEQPIAQFLDPGNEVGEQSETVCKSSATARDDDKLLVHRGLAAPCQRVRRGRQIITAQAHARAAVK